MDVVRDGLYPFDYRFGQAGDGGCRHQPNPYLGNRLSQRRRHHGNAPLAKKKVWWKMSSESKRKKRVVRYNVYTIEGKVKSCFKKGLRWLKKRIVCRFYS